MSTISKSGIAVGQIIRSEHLLRVINALDGTTSDDITISGSLKAVHITGSFKGDGSQLTNITGEWDGTLDGDAEITGSLIVTSGITGVLQGYIHEQTDSSVEWEIRHDLNILYPIVFVYDNDSQPYQIIPYNLNVIDRDNITIRFPTAQSGHARII